MTPAQQSLYFREWGAVRKHLLAQGLDAKQADAKRHELHARALGRAMSSKAFRNADLDKVLALFRSITRPADLAEQMRLNEQPEKRRADLVTACYDAAWRMYELGENRLGKSIRQEAYLAGLARKVLGKEFAVCGASEVAVILGILQRRVAQLEKKGGRYPGAVAASTGEGANSESDGNPF